MASVKVKFRASTVEGRDGRIFYQVIHERCTRHLQTDYRLSASEWDEQRSEIKVPQSGDRMAHLASCRERIKCDLIRFAGIIKVLEDDGRPYSTERVIEEFNRSIDGPTLFNEIEKAITRLTNCGRIRTAQAYASTMRSFMKYRNGSDVPLDSVTTEVMEGYQGWLQLQGLTQNSVSFYMRILRAVYNRAVDDDLTENRRPFRRVYTGVGRTVKRALPLITIKKIKDLDLTQQPGLAYARDMFILSFMLRGMSFIDMAYLRKTDLNNGHIIYRRRKTRQQLIIAWTREMQRLLDRYEANTSKYLFPIIRREGINERCAVKNAGERINQRLKKVGEMAGVGIPLSMYVARHSWASVAKSRGVPLSVISEGLGHEKESTTRIYLAQLDTSAVDKANEMILKLL